MKLTFLLMLTAMLTAHASGISQTITLSVRDMPLEQVFEKVKKSSPYVFFYKKEDVQRAAPVTIDARNISIEQFLQQVLNGQPLKFSIEKNSVIISNKINGKIEVPTVDQLLDEEPPVTVLGRVTNQDGNPIAGASILMNPGKIALATNDAGVFSIPNVRPGTYTIEVSNIGFTKVIKRVIVGAYTGIITFTLERQISEEDEIIISTGYSNKKIGEVTGSTQKISGDILRRGITTSDPASLLRGRAAGLYISEQNAGDPTSSGGQIFVRGQSNIAGVGIDNANEFVMPSFNYGPLIVLDGVIMPNQNLKELVNPQDIQDITILKDAAATAIYGSRAAAGVLVVTTKRSRMQNPRVSAEVKYGINKPNQGRLKFTNGPELYNLQKEFYTVDYDQNPAVPGAFPTLQDYLDFRLPTQAEVDNSFDWADYVFRTTNTTEVNTSVTGGNDRTHYYMGGSYYNEQSTGMQNSLVRKTFRLNLESRLTDRLKATISINGILNNGRRDPDDNANFSFYQIMPWANPYNSDGSIKQTLNFKRAGAPVVTDNPLFNRQYNFNTVESQLFFGSARLEYKITDWLSVSSTNSGNLNYGKDVRYFDNRTYTGGSSIFASQGFLGTSTNNLMNYLTSNQLTFNNKFGDHSFRALAAFEFGQTTTDNTLVNVNQVRAGYPVISLGRRVGGPSDLSIFGIPATKAGNIEGGKDKRAVYSVFGEAGYTYKEKLTLSGSIRSDASSSFGRNNRYGTFYSGGVAWIMSNEQFLQGQKWIDNLKVRTSYGTSGSQLGDNFLTQTLYNPTINYSNQGGATIAVLGNPNLRWEVTKTFSAGLEFSIFKNVNGTIDFYNRRSEDLLQKVMLPNLAGFPSQWQNVASVNNRGVEVLINWDIFKGKNFQWNSSVNFTYNKNQVVSVAGDSLKQGYYDQNRYYLFNGEDINSYKAVKYAGVDPQTGRPLFEKLIFDEKGVRTGVEYVNSVAEVDPSTDSRQLQSIGSWQPRYFGGFSNTFTYKQISLSVLVTYAIKYVMRSSYAETAQGRNLTRVNQLKYTGSQTQWTTPGQTNATEPWFYYHATTEYFGTDKYVHDASNAALRNVRLSYDLPGSLMTRMKISNCTVYLSGDNLATIYSKNIIASSPEGPSVGNAQDFGNAGGILGIPRRYMIGLQLTF